MRRERPRRNDLRKGDKEIKQLSINKSRKVKCD